VTLTLEWTVKIGGLDTNTDFTNRVTGLSINQPLGFMQGASHKCAITLNNFDGALTPGAGGTYSSVAWFEQAIFITCTVNSTDTAEVFHGIIDDFDIQDDGVTSTVTISGSDWFSIGARGFRTTTFTNTTDTYDWTEWASRIIDSFTTQNVPAGTTSIPKLDQTRGLFSGFTGTVDYYAASTVQTGFKGVAGDSIADVLMQRHQGGVPSVIWPTTIDKWTISGTDYARYRVGMIGDTLSRTDTDATVFTFTEGTPAAGELPITKIDRGFIVDRLINQASITSIYTTNTSTAVVSSSTSTSGIKSIWANESTMKTDADAQRMADNIVARFSNVHFQARRLVVDSAALASTNSGSSDELAELLDVRYGLWQACTVEYTPTGAGSATTDNCVIAGRRISAVPGRTTIDLELLPAADYQSFVLDSTVLGVLNQNRLG
jgi:hypothetical protein